MGHPPIEELLPQANYSIYKLVKLAANRAVELADGRKKLIEAPSSEKLATIALEEIREKKVVLDEAGVSLPETQGAEGAEESDETEEKEPAQNLLVKGEIVTKKIKQIVLGVTGSIAAYKAGDIIRRLKDAGFNVAVIMTEEAENFITPLTLAALSEQPVYRKMFDKNEKDWEIDHIPLAQKADALLIAPATANVIGKIACGIADDLLTCTAMATKAPIVFAPAMNDNMYENAIMQENCQKLKKFGMKFVGPKKGKLACGTIGEGHLADIQDIVAAVKKALS